MSYSVWVANLVGVSSYVHQKALGLISSQDTYLGCQFDPWSGHIGEATNGWFSHINVSLSFPPPPLLLFLKINKYILR